ncbi:MAG: ParB N-terminal domain-containing protein [Thermoplasmata archaeon]
MIGSEHWTELMFIPLDAIEPCPIQPRVNTSVDLIARLAASIRAGRHEPLLEVEPLSADRFQIVCGEQRWRAAREAGLTEVLVRLHRRRLGYLERLRKQYEENSLRADLEVIEEAHLLVLDRMVRSALAAERLLREASIPFQALDDKRITRRDEFAEHFGDLKRLLMEHRIHVIRTEAGLDVGPLSPWSATEKALGISETQRKARVGLLRLDSDLQDAVRSLPAEHAFQIARVDDRPRQEDLVRRAPYLTTNQIRAVVERLRSDEQLSVDGALADGAAAPKDCRALDDDRSAVLADLCRQLVRLLRNLHGTDEELRAREFLQPLYNELVSFIHGSPAGGALA